MESAKAFATDITGSSVQLPQENTFRNENRPAHLMRGAADFNEP
jgi:hypothetical protein